MPVSISSVDQLQAGTQDDIERERALLQQQAAQKYATADADLQALLGAIEAEKAKGQVYDASAPIDMRDPNWRAKHAERMAAMGNSEVAGDYAANGQWDTSDVDGSGQIGLTDYGTYDKLQKSKQAADAYSRKIQSAAGIQEELGKKFGGNSIEALLLGDQATGQGVQQSDASKSLEAGMGKADESLAKLEEQQSQYANIQGAKVNANNAAKAKEDELARKQRYLDYLDSQGAQVALDAGTFDPNYSANQQMADWYAPGLVKMPGANQIQIQNYQQQMAKDRRYKADSTIAGLLGIASGKAPQEMSIDERIAWTQDKMNSNKKTAGEKTGKSYSWDDYGSWGG